MAAAKSKGQTSTTLQGGALYRAALVQLAKANGFKVASEGTTDTLTKGTSTLVLANGSNGVLTSVKDGKGTVVVKAGTSLRWEAAAQLVSTGKLVPASLKGVVLTKAQRAEVAAGTFKAL